MQATDVPVQITRLRKSLVLLGCVAAMATAFAHAFPTTYGFSGLRSLTGPSMGALGINQQWRMFTTTVLNAIPSKLSLTYASGSTEVVVIRAEQVGFSRSAENRFMESTLWSPRSVVVGGFLQASCRRYAKDGDLVTSIALLQAKIALPPGLYNLPPKQQLTYVQVRSERCKSL